MVSFSAILSPSCAEVNIQAENKDDALKAAVELISRSGKVADPGKLLEEIRGREVLASTGIGEGVGLPHAMSDAVSQTMLGVLRLVSPVPFGAQDQKPVDLLFIIAGPRGETSAHLQLLSKLARLLHDEHFRDSLRRAENGEALAQILYAKD
ncbi:PTS sugar transporter subunit IIA [Treponema sp. OttesenSCG-928-L16]|nr:PTS sugar transporter subunit IIA [Treponema sp. OttesenSCG-928-L16]